MKVDTLKDRIALAITTVGGVGYTPGCPGTASCVIALLIFVVVKSQALFFAIAVVSLILAYTFSSRAEELFQEKDSSKIVVDDFSGMLITYLFIPHDIRFIISGFFLFRMLDMLKVPPAHIIEASPGAKGIVGDDLIAGIYANVMLHIARFFI